MITTALRKSTVRPWPSVRRPSSSSWSRTLNTSGCAFSISSSRTTRVRPAAHGLGELPALLVADVAGRRADQTRDGVLLLVLTHVDAHHGAVVIEQEVGQGAGQLGLADARRPEEDERPDRPVESCSPERERRTALATACSAGSCPTTRSRSRSSMWISFSISPSSKRETGMPVQRATTWAMSSASTSSLSRAPGACSPARRCSPVLQAGLQIAQRAVAQAGRGFQVGASLGLLDLIPCLFDLLFQRAQGRDRLLLALPAGAELVGLLAQVGQFGLEARSGAPPRRCPSPSSAPGARSRAASGGGRLRPGPAVWSRSPCAAGRRPRRSGRWPCPGRWRSAM